MNKTAIERADNIMRLSLKTLLLTAVLVISLVLFFGNFIAMPRTALACEGACCGGGGGANQAAGSSGGFSQISASAIQSVNTSIDKAINAFQNGDTNGAIAQLILAKLQLSTVPGISVGNGLASSQLTITTTTPTLVSSTGAGASSSSRC